jgi:hypothetical protein
MQRIFYGSIVSGLELFGGGGGGSMADTFRSQFCALRSEILVLLTR